MTDHEVPDSPASIDTPLHRLHQAAKEAREAGEPIDRIINVAALGGSTPAEQAHVFANQHKPGHSAPEETALVYGGVQDMLDAADKLDHITALVDEHGDALRAEIGGAVRNAEVYGDGWIRISCKEVAGQPGVYDWIFAAPHPRTITIREDQ